LEAGGRELEAVYVHSDDNREENLDKNKVKNKI